MTPFVTATTTFAANFMSVRAALVELTNRIEQQHGDDLDWSVVSVESREEETDGPVPLRHLSLRVGFDTAGEAL